MTSPTSRSDIRETAIYPAARSSGSWRRQPSGQESKVILTGAASAEKYAAMAAEPLVSLYTSVSPSELLDKSRIAATETDRFANLEILQTADARVFFDPRVEEGLPYASPIQTYLELTVSDKRQKDAAEQVRRGILATLGEF